MTPTTTLTQPPPRTSGRLAQAPPGSVQDGSLTPAVLEQWRAEFDAEPACRVAQNAVTRTAIDEVALNRAVLTSTDHTFSHVLDDWAVTNQKKSGRCWMFAGLNLFRVGAMKQMNLKDFEFSQNYTLFWDKLERSNYFLEAIIETAHLDVDDRTVAFLLDRPLEDGGQWNMFVNIVRKHGLAPKAVMPETESSSHTARMNANLRGKLRQAAMLVRELRANGAPLEALRAEKRDVLGDIHRMLCIHLGTPPAAFDWQWNDKDRAFHRDGPTTPREFAQRYVQLPLDEYVCLVHDPRPGSPVNRTFTVQYLGNVVGGQIVRYLNVDIQVMKDVAMRSIMGGEPVWMGCDVGKMMHRELGVWDAELFEYETLYDTDLSMTKAQRLQYHQTQMTHAMLFTGVDVTPGISGTPGTGPGIGPGAGQETPRRWRVENSWGDEGGRKGFYVMNDSWFDEHMFEIAARRSLLPAPLREAIELEPIVLPPWDPMGALAR